MKLYWFTIWVCWMRITKPRVFCNFPSRLLSFSKEALNSLITLSHFKKLVVFLPQLSYSNEIYEISIFHPFFFTSNLVFVFLASLFLAMIAKIIFFVQRRLKCLWAMFRNVLVLLLFVVRTLIKGSSLLLEFSMYAPLAFLDLIRCWFDLGFFQSNFFSTDSWSSEFPSQCFINKSVEVFLALFKIYVLWLVEIKKGNWKWLEWSNFDKMKDNELIIEVH